MKKELTIQEQINFLKKAKENISHTPYAFVCVNLWFMIKDKGFGEGIARNDSSHTVEFFPLLTIENARTACREKHVTMPKILLSEAWWDHKNWKSRIAFINWMIKELERVDKL